MILMLTLSATRRTPHAAHHEPRSARHGPATGILTLCASLTTCRSPLAQPIVDHKPGSIGEDRGTLSFQLKSVPLMQSHSGWMERKEKKYGFGVR